MLKLNVQLFKFPWDYFGKHYKTIPVLWFRNLYFKKMSKENKVKKKKSSLQRLHGSII